MSVYKPGPPPYVYGLDCNCDPFDDGPFGHDPDCPADEPSREIMWEWRRAAPLLADLAHEIGQQDRRYGTFFPADVQTVRLAAAALEDEAEEVRRAWRAERKDDGWTEVRAETLQVAAVAIRLLRDLADAERRANRRAKTTGALDPSQNRQDGGPDE